MSRLGPLVLLFGLLWRCGGGVAAPAPPHVSPVPARHPPARTVVLRPGEHRTFRAGSLHPGDVVRCVASTGGVRIRVPNRPTGGWAIGTETATPAGHGTQLQLSSSVSGAVTATCRG